MGVLGELTLGEAMKIFREEKQWTRAEMARFLGTTRRTYWAIETGRNTNPCLRTVWEWFREACRVEAIVECPTNPDHYHIVAEKSR